MLMNPTTYLLSLRFCWTFIISHKFLTSYVAVFWLYNQKVIECSLSSWLYFKWHNFISSIQMKKFMSFIFLRYHKQLYDTPNFIMKYDAWNICIQLWMIHNIFQISFGSYVQKGFHVCQTILTNVLLRVF